MNPSVFCTALFILSKAGFWQAQAQFIHHCCHLSIHLATEFWIGVFTYSGKIFSAYLFVFLDSCAKYLFESEILNSNHVKDWEGKGTRHVWWHSNYSFCQQIPLFFLCNDLSLLYWEPLPYAGKKARYLGTCLQLACLAGVFIPGHTQTSSMICRKESLWDPNQGRRELQGGWTCIK